MKARRDRALVLANSSYALRRLKRTAEARARAEQALAILEETKDYPSGRINLDSEICVVLQALADQSADEGQVDGAIRQYQQLLEKVTASAPDVEHDLRAAYSLSLLYRDLARLNRLAGASSDADAVAAKSQAIWTQWNQTRPNNSFVLRQLAAASTAAPQAGRPR